MAHLQCSILNICSGLKTAFHVFLAFLLNSLFGNTDNSHFKKDFNLQILLLNKGHFSLFPDCELFNLNLSQITYNLRKTFLGRWGYLNQVLQYILIMWIFVVTVKYLSL